MQESIPYVHRDNPNAPPLLVFFKEEPVKNEKASQGGPPVYDVVTYLRIAAPGQQKSFPIYEICRRFEDGTEKIDKGVHARFWQVYDQYRAKQAPSAAGTPLEQWPLMDVAQVRAFKDANIFTVQQLAELGDNGIENVRKGREWRARAQSWLQEAKAASNDEDRARIAKLEEELAETKELLKQALAGGNNLGFEKKGKARRKSEEDVEGSVAATLAASDEPAEDLRL